MTGTTLLSLRRRLPAWLLLVLGTGCPPTDPETVGNGSRATCEVAGGVPGGRVCMEALTIDPCRRGDPRQLPECALMRSVAEHCCVPATAAPADLPQWSGFRALGGCVAGVEVLLESSCNCVSPCANEACRELRIPSFRVTLTNCGNVASWVSATPQARLFLFTRAVETGDIFVPGMPNYEPVTEAWWLPGMVALRPGEQVERLVPMWGVRFGSGEPGDVPEGELQHLGPPPTGWYSVRAVLYLPERGRGTRWPDALWFCEDGSALAECLAPLAAGQARAPDYLCGGAGTVGYLPPRPFLSELAGFDCVWPLNAPASDPIWTTGALSSNELLVYVDAGPLTADPRLMRHPMEYPEEAAGEAYRESSVGDVPPPPTTGPPQADGVDPGSPAAGGAEADQRGEATGPADS